MQYQMMNNDDDITNPVMRGVSLLDDTSTANYTSDGETATSTLASDDPFSLLYTHESYRDSVHSKLFGITDDDSSFFGGNTRRSTWSHTDTASYSNAGSSYEEMPFMASISNNNTNNNTNNNSVNINDDNDNDDREKEDVSGMMGQNEQPSTPSTPVNDITNDSDPASIQPNETNNDYACEMLLETNVILNKFVNGTILIVQAAFGCCYDQVDGFLIRLYSVRKNNNQDVNNNNDNDIGNKEKEKESLSPSIAPIGISEEKDESREDVVKDTTRTDEQTSTTIAESKATTNELTPRSSDMRDDSNITHRDNNNKLLAGKTDPPVTTALSNDSTMNESVQRFKEYLYNRYEDKNQSESKETTNIDSMEDTDDWNGIIVTPLSRATKQINDSGHTSVTKGKNGVDIQNYESINNNLNTSTTTTKPTTDQLSAVDLSYVNTTTSHKDTSVTISMRDRYLAELPRRISTVVNQLSTDMLREENNIDSQTRTRKETEMIKHRLNSSLSHIKSIEGCEDHRDDQIESSQSTSTTSSNIQRMKCHTQEERKLEITIDLTMMEDIL